MNRILMILSALVLGAIYLVACSPATEPSGSATPLQPTASSNPTGTQAQPSLAASAPQTLTPYSDTLSGPPSSGKPAKHPSACPPAARVNLCLEVQI